MFSFFIVQFYGSIEQGPATGDYQNQVGVLMLMMSSFGILVKIGRKRKLHTK